MEKLGVQKKNRKKIQSSIYGTEHLTSGIKERKAGLIDCHTENELRNNLFRVRSEWQTLEAADANSEPRFPGWFWVTCFGKSLTACKRGCRSRKSPQNIHYQ